MTRERSEYTPTVMYAAVDGCIPVYYRTCPKCGRFIKPDDRTRIPEYQGDEPNATCKKCGRVQMEFCTWVDEYDAFAEGGQKDD